MINVLLCLIAAVAAEPPPVLVQLGLRFGLSRASGNNDDPVLDFLLSFVGQFHSRLILAQVSTHVYDLGIRQNRDAWVACHCFYRLFQ